MYSIFHDIRFGLRMLIKTPGFTIIALVTLALGIGVNTATYSLFHAESMIPYRFEKPEELVFLWQPSEFYERSGLSYPDYTDFREQAESFAEMGIYNMNSGIITGDGEPEMIRTLRTNANLLPMLGFRAQTGRFYTVEEESPAADKVAVLSNDLWQRRYGKDPEVLGRTIILNDQPYTIIGVMPEEIDFDTFWRDADLVTPLSIDPAGQERNLRYYNSVARLKPGVTVEQAQAEMDGITARLAEAYPKTNADTETWVEPLLERFLLPMDDYLLTLAVLAAVGLVLVITCVNLAGLLLAKAASRTKEFAVRGAMGAGRIRIIRQLLVESLLLALSGGALGLLVGFWAVNLIMYLVEYIPYRAEEVGLNPPVLIYTFCMTFMSAVFFGLFPALSATKVSLHDELKESSAAASAGHSRNRLRNALIVGQLAFAMPLLVCCGMVVKHLIGLKAIDFGYNTERLLTVQIILPNNRYNTYSQWTEYYRDVVENIEATPGIESAGAGVEVPVFGGGNIFGGSIAIEGRLHIEPTAQDVRGFKVVTPGYFETLQVPLISGRFFNENDHADAQPVAIVNQRMVRQYWPNEDPLGKRFTYDKETSEVKWITIVGVVGDVGRGAHGEPPDAAVYLPFRQKPTIGMVVVARTIGDPMDYIGSVRSAIHSIDAGVPISNFETVKAIAHRWLREDRMSVWFLGGLAVLALGLASIGLYGIMSYTVVQRTHEIGIRVALGAVGKDILWMVIRRCLKLAIIGIFIGLVISIPVGFFLASLLYKVGRFDPITVGGVIIIFLLVAMLSGYLPARRATRVDPLTALRYE